MNKYGNTQFDVRQLLLVHGRDQSLQSLHSLLVSCIKTRGDASFMYFIQKLCINKANKMEGRKKENEFDPQADRTHTEHLTL